MKTSEFYSYDKFKVYGKTQSKIIFFPKYRKLPMCGYILYKMDLS